MRKVAFAFVSIAAVAAFASPAAAEGFRAEIHSGWDHVAAGGQSDDGILYGVAVGYDLAVSPSMFVGLEAGIDDSTAKECDGSVIVANDQLCLKSGRDLSAVARIGYNVWENGKLYVLAGYTNARLKSSYTSGNATTSDAANLDGFRAGGGYQHAFGSRTYAKVEYRYSNYEAGVERHQLLAGVGISF